MNVFTSCTFNALTLSSYDPYLCPFFHVLYWRWTFLRGRIWSMCPQACKLLFDWYNCPSTRIKINEKWIAVCPRETMSFVFICAVDAMKKWRLIGERAWKNIQKHAVMLSLFTLVFLEVWSQVTFFLRKSEILLCHQKTAAVMIAASFRDDFIGSIACVIVLVIRSRANNLLSSLPSQSGHGCERKRDEYYRKTSCYRLRLLCAKRYEQETMNGVR